ncbi:MAG: hypothetical protein ACYC35_10200 [Pirellulales bacterium]
MLQEGKIMRTHCLVLAALLAALAEASAFGENLFDGYRLSDGNSTALVQTYGVTDWNIDPSDTNLYQVWQLAWFYSKGGAAQNVTELTNLLNAQHDPANQLSLSFDAGSGLQIDVTYTLTGAPSGRFSKLEQTVVFKNTGADLNGFRVYGLSDFDLGSSEDNTVSIAGDIATQIGPDGWKAVETVNTPSSRVAAGGWTSIANMVGEGRLLPLDQTEYDGSDGSAAYAYQWDFNLGANQSATFIRTATLVPEPASLTMAVGALALGGPIVLLLRRRKRRA